MPRKPDEIVALNVRLPAKLHTKVKRMAQKHLRSMNAQIVWMLSTLASQESDTNGDGSDSDTDTKAA